ncbi:MAG: Leucyl/phenylalanyl-tRNA--protein transferase [Phycisphaerales bacterium]|nr:Leucyl/phenylalanyl-tRNA--protein transferase [Phycisphaerales bacterium]
MAEFGLIEGVLAMYRLGWFPMADAATGDLDWFRPRRRGVLPLVAPGFQVPRSLRQKVRAGRFEIRTDTAFRDVITACSKPRPAEPHSWIDARIIETYCLLHDAGHAHSVEAWYTPVAGEERLVGGLYGIHLGGVFFGESMFCLPDQGGTDASKVCLVHLVHHMRRRGMTLLDTQLWNRHLAQFGCRELPHGGFIKLLDAALRIHADWLPFEAAKTTDDMRRPAP